MVVVTQSAYALTAMGAGSIATPYQGYIGEFRVYDGALPNGDTDVSDITTALATKWGITL